MHTLELPPKFTTYKKVRKFDRLAGIEIKMEAKTIQQQHKHAKPKQQQKL